MAENTNRDNLKLGVFASGRGSNFQTIVASIHRDRIDAEVKLLISNNEDAGALQYAESQHIPTCVINRKMFSSRQLFLEALLKVLKTHDVNFIVLAGYMKKIPSEVIEVFRNRILNIHPALLPSFGGKGMYGHFVHEAVVAHGCKVSGVTIHVVDDLYDHGPIVAQRCVPVFSRDTADDLAKRILKVEHALYPEVLAMFADGRIEVKAGKVTIKAG